MRFLAKNFRELTTVQLYELLKSRSQIFMLEQGIHCLDMDDIDYISRHYFMEDDKRIIAYLRAYYIDPNHKIVKLGRVLTLQHGLGMGAELMEKSIADIQANMKCEKLCVDAQVQAAGFYEKMGFCAASDDFLEEGIPHIRMERKI